MSHTNNNTITHNLSIEQASHTGTRDTLSDSESLLGIICQDCVQPKTPRLEAIAERYHLQSVARSLLPTERIAQCLRTLAPNKQHVEIHRNDENKTAHYKNLLTCARVWFCPICSARISEGRAQELTNFCAHWNAERGSMALITYTLSHSKKEPLSKTLDTLLEAYRKFKSGRKFQSIKEATFWYGSVRTLEITYTANGWHPHIHELVFFELDRPQTKREQIPEMKTHWQNVAKRAGGTASKKNGLDFATANTKIYDYITKYGHRPTTDSWSIDREVTKAVAKRASGKGRTPWQLLADYAEGDQQAGKLFQEYAITLKGRNQLVWSRNLKQEYTELEKITDEELTTELDETYTLFTTLSATQWKAIRDLPHDIRGELLAHAGMNDRVNFLSMLIANNIPVDVEF